jgi:hypothetical protein
MDVRIGGNRVITNASGIYHRRRFLFGKEEKCFIPWKDITETRWGIHEDFFNGARTRLSYMIFVGTENTSMNIECVEGIFFFDEEKARKIYFSIIKKLYEGACNRMVGEYLQKVVSGETVEICAGVKMNKEGLILPATRYFVLRGDPEQVQWLDILYTSRDGSLILKSSKSRRPFASCSYRDDSNTHLLENILDIARGGKRLQRCHPMRYLPRCENGAMGWDTVMRAQAAMIHGGTQDIQDIHKTSIEDLRQ